VRPGPLLNRLTIGWNALEGIVAVAAGLAAGSVSLIGFGLDSGIEVSTAVILAWRLAQERGQGCTQAADRRATRAIAVSFLALAAWVGVESIRDLLGRAEPEASLPGIILAARAAIGVQNPCPKSTSHSHRCRRVMRRSAAWEICSAMPASPPPTSNPSCRSTPSPLPAATGCSPRPPVAPASTARSSSSSRTSCAPATP
jgi:hypothetical protein